MAWHYNPHSQFKLNGGTYSLKNLKELSQTLVVSGESYEKVIGNFLLHWLSDSPTIEVYTSGSTGKPKSIFLQKQHMVNSALATGAFFNLKSGDSALLCLNVNAIAGKMMLIRALVLGLELDYVAPASNVLKLITRTYNFCAMVPLQVDASIDKLHLIKTLIVGGATMSMQLKKAVQELPVQVFETYGMTETITHIAVKKVSVSLSGVENLFKVLPNIQISQDNRGCLVVDAPSITDVPVVTNDIVKLHSKTEFEWLGRFDTIINSGGVKLISEEIEAKLASVIKSRFFVAGIPDEKLGQKLVLVVEGNQDVSHLISIIKEKGVLQKYETPKNVYCLSIFEESNGKISRKIILTKIKF